MAKRGPGAPKGPRPHARQYPDPLDHKMYYAFMRMRAQAKFRGELFYLTFKDFQELWAGRFEQRGRTAESLVLTKRDLAGVWERDNVHVINRQEQLKRDGAVRRQRPRLWRQE